MPRRLEYQHRLSLETRPDEAATRELVDFFVDGDDGTRREVARALAKRTLPDDVRARVAALILDDTFDGAEGVNRWGLTVAAQALLALPVEEAFALAEPLLDVTASSRSFDLQRAETIVIALEALLALWSTQADEVWFVDHSFRRLCEQIRQDDSWLAHMAAQAIDGFRHFDGEAVEPIARNVSLGEDGDPPFPFLVAGFPVETLAQRTEIETALGAVARGRPPGLAWFHHQYGGYACLQERILGYGVVPPAGAPFAEVLAALSETCMGSFGDPMTEPELLVWSGRLAGILPPEGAARGAEALLVSPPCAPIHTLAGRDVLGFGYEGAPWRRDIDMGFEPDLRPVGPYQDDHERVLVSVGEALGLGRPRVALLWGNSD
jgi:hypothetical protein